MHTPRLARDARFAVLALIILLSFPCAAAVSLVDIPQNKEFPNATADHALQLACSEDRNELEQHFARHSIRFVPELVRNSDGMLCHIYYEPTRRGFRVHADSVPVHGLFMDLEHVTLLSQRDMQFGDSLDIAKVIAANLQRPLHITLSVPLKVNREWYDQALNHLFPTGAADIWLRDRPESIHNSWAQDYMKSGIDSDGERILIPRRAFEGEPGYGKNFKGLLKTFSEKTWAHSKLSWEGGDLLFVNDPRKPNRLLLIHGDAARPYWGDRLTDGEYNYVLAAEFGADEALDFGGIAAHVDYFVSFLPGDHIALVSQPLQEDYEVSVNALKLLMATFFNPVPPVLQELAALYESRESAFVTNQARVRALIDRARRESISWAVPVSAESYNRIETYTAKHCRGNPADCLSPRRLPSILNENPQLLQDWIEATQVMRTAEALPRSILSVLESQLPGTPVRAQELMEKKIAELQERGFKVIRVPSIGGDPEATTPWAGISYVNAALIDDTLFVPTFGLGAPEQKFVDLLQAQLPESYKVVPVFARYSQLYNGGVHCVLAFLRDPQVLMTSEPQPSEPGPHQQPPPYPGIPVQRFLGENQ